MTAFWKYARRLGKRRGALALALLFAFISAGGLGAGLLGLVPILKNLLTTNGVAMPQLAQQVNEKLEAFGIRIPQPIIDRLPTDRFETVVWLIGGLIALTILGAAANFMHTWIALTISTNTIADIREAAYTRVIRLPLSGIVGRTSDTISRILVDARTLEQGFASLTGKAVAQLTKGIAAFAAALLIDWKLTLTALVVAPALYTIVRKLGKRIRRASRKALQAQADLLDASTETLHALRVVKAYTAEDAEQARFQTHNQQVVHQELKARTAKAMTAPVTETLSIIALGVLSIAAAKLILSGGMSPDVFIAALGSLAIAGASLKPLSGIVQKLYVASAAAQRLDEVFAIEPETGADIGPALPRHRATIEFRGIVFAYPGAPTPSINQVSLTIRHGETVAFVGPNGSGKTTLLSLVPRLFEPDAGSVLIDGNDIANVSLGSLRRQIGVVTQETVLFRGTIESNIAYGASGPVEHDRIVRAAVAARADGFIRQKEGGYRAVVGERGLTLSGGQRQRIAIARALLRDPAILILDEATSMIDAESEARIGEAIAEFSKGRTCLIVAHRLSTVLGADRIVVMESGRVVSTGRHEELLETCPVYRSIAGGQLIPTAV
ncbi:MAG: ABC transporter ATP-binding protein [Phycisphaeraceae bacterium]|nr:ABC transporter ATP-binding protein [Phycisphaeraceae bacterium]